MNDNMCRICLNIGLSENTSVFIFDSDENSIQYSTKILTCVNMSLGKDDGLPSRICKLCIEELTVAYRFVQKCLSSDSTLRKYKLTDKSHKVEQCEEMINTTEQTLVKEEFGIKEESSDLDTTQNESCEDILLDDSSEKIIEVRKKPRSNKTSQLQCTECGKLVSTPSIMVQHMRTHTGERPYACDVCGAQFKLKGALVRHKGSHDVTTRQQFICEYCGKHFTSKKCIAEHFKVHTNEKLHSCKICHKKFTQQSSLSRHKKVHLPEKSYLCSVCGKAFRDKPQVQRHTKTVHSDIKNFRCHLCNKSFKRNTTLKTHLQYIHSDEMNSVCNFCGAAFKTKGSLKLHIDRRHSQKSGSCEICFKEFSDIQSHMYKHSGEKPFVCSKCDQAFHSKRSLAYHISIKHENAAKFKCSVEDCKKTFPILPRLQYHLAKEHNHKMSHKCSYCVKGFIRSCDLTKHLRTAHMDKTSLAKEISVKSNK